MDAKTIIIILLIGYMAFWYNSPDKGKEFLETGVDKVKSVVIDFTSGECSEDYNPVCASEVNYDNACLAGKAGEVNATLGVCSG